MNNCYIIAKIIDYYTNQILNGKTNFAQFNQAEHAGLCRAGEVLVGAYVVCNYAQASLTASADAGTGQTIPANWEIDEQQETFVQQSCSHPEAVNVIVIVIVHAQRVLSPSQRDFPRHAVALTVAWQL